MKITSLTINGFKGISHRTEIPLAPITLFFGANSTGKSTILHALLYLHEIIVNRNFNPHYCSITGEDLWLGGFQNLVNGKNLEKTITLGATLDFRDNKDDIWDNYLSDTEVWLLEDNLQYWPDTTVDTVSIEIELAWDEFQKRVFVSRFECSSEDKTYLKFETQAGKPSVAISQFNPLSNWNLDGPFETNNIFSSGNWETIYIKGNDALPSITERIDLSSVPIEWNDLLPDYPLVVRLFFEAALSQAALAPLKILANKLTNILHIGPLRIVPTRNSLFYNNPEPSNWYNGSAGWDTFAFGSNNLKNKVNNIFKNNEFLDSGYEFNVDILGENPLQQRRILLTELSSNTILHPTNVGVGVSQLFPFITATCLDKNYILSCEQPELHIHPKWQLSLADIMITACNDNDDRMFLIETHSEHLMLRLLKRVTEDYSSESNNLYSKISIINIYKHNEELYYQKQLVTKDGEFELDWPQGFFEERYGEN